MPRVLQGHHADVFLPVSYYRSLSALTFARSGFGSEYVLKDVANRIKLAFTEDAVPADFDVTNASSVIDSVLPQTGSLFIRRTITGDPSVAGEVSNTASDFAAGEAGVFSNVLHMAVGALDNANAAYAALKPLRNGNAILLNAVTAPDVFIELKAAPTNSSRNSIPTLRWSADQFEITQGTIQQGVTYGINYLAAEETIATTASGAFKGIKLDRVGGFQNMAIRYEKEVNTFFELGIESAQTLSAIATWSASGNRFNYDDHLHFIPQYPAWSNTGIYASGDKVTFSGHVWQATTAIAAGQANPGSNTNWARLAVQDVNEDEAFLISVFVDRAQNTRFVGSATFTGYSFSAVAGGTAVLSSDIELAGTGGLFFRKGTN